MLHLKETLHATVKTEDLMYCNKDTALPLFLFKYGNKILHVSIYLKGCANVINWNICVLLKLICRCLIPNLIIIGGGVLGGN